MFGQKQPSILNNFNDIGIKIIQGMSERVSEG